MCEKQDLKFHSQEEITSGQLALHTVTTLAQIYFSILDTEDDIGISAYSPNVIKRIFEVYRKQV